MATAVESPGIVSAKEEAAAILFAREPQTAPEMVVPTYEEAVQQHEQPVRPTFASYHEPEIIHARPKVVDTTVLRPYETYEEVAVETEPKVVRPYIDSRDYLTSPVTATTVEVTTPVETVVEAPQTVTVVESPLDKELEEGTQYVVKFKKSTIAAVSVAASFMALMLVLFVVNIVSLVMMSSEVSALTQNAVTLEQTLSESRATLEEAQNAAMANGGSTQDVQYVAHITTAAPTSTDVAVDGSFFNWLCQSLSRLFN